MLESNGVGECIDGIKAKGAGDCNVGIDVPDGCNVEINDLGE